MKALELGWEQAFESYRRKKLGSIVGNEVREIESSHIIL